MKRAKSLNWIQQCKEFVRGAKSPNVDRKDKKQCSSPTCRLWASADQLHKHRLVIN